MQLVILAGGYGSRISEESFLKPKPMIEIGYKPIIWHIMKTYSFYGINEFIICCGYKGYMIKEYFANFKLYNSNITIDLSKNNEIYFHKSDFDSWKITLIDTGIDTMTGGRIKRINDYINGSTFCMTYGDGLSDVNINKLINFHQVNGKKVTLTAVKQRGRFGILQTDENNLVKKFKEKPEDKENWINGGFFVIEKSALNFIENDQTSWESEPLEEISKVNELCAYKHYGFWAPMDTLRDKIQLEKIWNSGEAPWKVWS